MTNLSALDHDISPVRTTRTASATAVATESPVPEGATENAMSPTRPLTAILRPRMTFGCWAPDGASGTKGQNARRPQIVSSAGRSQGVVTRAVLKNDGI